MLKCKYFTYYLIGYYSLPLVPPSYFKLLMLLIPVLIEIAVIVYKYNNNVVKLDLNLLVYRFQY